MRAWMVRAGSDGQREEEALDRGLLLPGWVNIHEDLSACRSREQVRHILQSVYGESQRERTLRSWAGQMWRFVNDMSNGDIVVMPLKREPGIIAIGKITGSYCFDEDGTQGAQHIRSIDWMQKNVQKDALGTDIQASLGTLLTICELWKNDAPNRLDVVITNGVDPEASPDDEAELANYVASIADDVEKGYGPSTTIRELLSRWGFYRRTSSSVETVTALLSEYGLLAVPPITDGAIDDEVVFVSQSGADGDANIDNTVISAFEVTEQQIDTAERASADVATGEVRYAVGSLPSASHSVEVANSGDLLSGALTKMAIKSYSQLAVVDEKNRLIGAITWESIAMALASGTPTTVNDAMIEAQSVTTSEELLSLTPRISDHGYVFVRDQDGRVQGIVSAADLTRKFGDDQTPIIQLEEIERRLGSHVKECCSDDEMENNGVRVPGSGKTLGTYVTCLSREPLWDKLGWHGVERESLHALMNEVRKIRNEIMHFSPDPITPQQLDTLTSAMRIMRLITDDPEKS